ncbi:hypothetical protein L2755_10755 [Shewanella abyssi]|uniref:hypothetical protein n=1 Tax=Shewanella abyssi TaxID=311789 RepID=UPI00200F9370|nr:hypothetical protein [Shewanella abyssi]MCL1050103.1 hypothetical protein [Shewanella abyssi]
MQKLAPVIFVILLFTGLTWTIVSINQSEQTSSYETWSSFIYKGGYNSSRYEKTDDFDDYPSCKAFSEQQSKRLNNVVWECGLNCSFDSMRQGYHCKTMTNE